jgi:hypothetical protein
LPLFPLRLPSAHTCQNLPAARPLFRRFNEKHSFNGLL